MVWMLRLDGRMICRGCGKDVKSKPLANCSNWRKHLEFYKRRLVRDNAARRSRYDTDPEFRKKEIARSLQWEKDHRDRYNTRLRQWYAKHKNPKKC